MSTALLGTSALLGYMAASGWLARRLQQGLQHTLLPAGLLAGAALLIHAWLLGQQLMVDNGLNLNLLNVISLIAWFMAGLLWVANWRSSVDSLALLQYPITGLAAISAALVDHQDIFLAASSWQLQLHVLLSITAYGLVALAALQAGLLWLQERRLRQQQSLFSHLPPLQSMERLLFLMLGSGFVLMSLALLSGLLFVDDLLAQHLVHKTILSFLSWAMIGGLLLGRWRFGWRGTQAVKWTIAACGTLLLAYVGSKFVLEWLLNRHWG